MDLNLLHLFLKVAEHESFSSAATALRMERSSVSRRIASLELTLGVKLFHRTTRRVRLTSAGEWLRSQLSPLISSIELVVETIPERASQPSGVLSVSVNTDIAMHILAPFLKVFHEQYQDVVVKMVITERIVDMEAEGVEVAIRGAISQLPDSSLIAKQLTNISAGLFVSPTYLETHPPLEHPDDLSEHDTVMIERFQGPSRYPFRPAAIVADDVLAVKACIEAGVGVGWLPLHMTHDDELEGRLVRVLPQIEFKGGKLFAVYPHSLRSVPRVRAFVDGLARFLKDGEV